MNIYIAIQRFNPAQVDAQVETFPLASAATIATDLIEEADVGVKIGVLTFSGVFNVLLLTFSGDKLFAVFKSASFLFEDKSLPFNQLTVIQLSGVN